MNKRSSSINSHESVDQQFFNMRTDARHDAIWAKLMGRSTKLATFPALTTEQNANKTCKGIEEIPVENIIGTLSRQDDFDSRFRPLNIDLRERWVNVCLSLKQNDYSPIIVHKLGEHYYVEDGHQRVSVARLHGWTCIQAKVWEYAAPDKQSKMPQTLPCTQRSATNAYAAR